jgi:serine/threonine-protein kinase
MIDNAPPRDVTARDMTDEDVLLGTSSGASMHHSGPARLDPVLPADAFVRAGVPLESHGAGGSTYGASRAKVEIGAAATRPLGRRRRRRERANNEDLLPRGAIVDKFRIDGLLGKGGFAVVYRATHLLLGTRVAIKLLRPKVLERQPTLTSLLCEEARFAACINHPNVVRILDVTTGNALTYIVMEYIDGPSLAQRIARSGPLPPASLLGVGQQIAAGLCAGLEQGLIHRDVKPANILLTKGGDAKLVDFGLAHPSAMPELPRVRSRSLIGTAGYMSPEQADDPETVDFRADIYSLGVTLYEAATGAPPFPIGDPSACMLLHKTQPVPAIASRLPDFPASLSALVLWMLAKDPKHRPSSYQELGAAMDAIAHELGASDV